MWRPIPGDRVKLYPTSYHHSVCMRGTVIALSTEPKFVDKDEMFYTVMTDDLRIVRFLTYHDMVVL